MFVNRRHSTRLFPTFSSFVSIYKQMVGGYVRQTFKQLIIIGVDTKFVSLFREEIFRFR